MDAESSSLLRWSETSLSRRTQTRTIVKVISKQVWNQGERAISTNTIPMAVETGSAQERPLSWHIKTSLLGAKQKQTLPPFQHRLWGSAQDKPCSTNRQSLRDHPEDISTLEEPPTRLLCRVHSGLPDLSSFPKPSELLPFCLLMQSRF